MNSNLNMMYDLLQTEIMNQCMYNRYMMDIQNPEVRQMFMQMSVFGKMKVSQKVSKKLAPQMA